MAQRLNPHRALALVFRLMLGAVTPLAVAAPASADDVVSPLVATPIAPPNPVLGADGKLHFAYELVLLNMGTTATRIKKVETLDAASGAVLGTLDGDALTQMLRLNGGGKGTELVAGGSGLLRYSARAAA